MSNAFKVGAFALVCLLVLGYFVLRIEDWDWFGADGERIDALFDSVAGLDDKAPVRVAGVRVGKVDGIRLDGARARVTLRLDRPLDLRVGSRAALASLGLLGDKYVEIIPGPLSAQALAAGAVLEGETPMTFDQAMAKLNDVAESIQGITGSLSGSGGESSLSRLIDNLEAVSADIRGLVATNREQVSVTIDNFSRFSGELADAMPRLSDRLDSVLAQIDMVMGENRANFQGTVENVRELTDRLRISADNINAITDQIASGEGTLGKLVKSDAAHDSLVATLASVDSGVKALSETLGKAQKLQLELGLEGAYLAESGEARSAFRLELDPQSGRFYRLEIVDDPRGRVRTKTREDTVTLPDGSTESTVTRSSTREDVTSLSAQFGLDFGAGRLRAGLIESTGGAGVDYRLLDRRLLLSLEAFDFGRREDGDEDELKPRLRLISRYSLGSNVYVLGGYDDFLEPRKDSLFLGFGVRWRDDDLKYLLGSLPRF